MNLSSIIQGIRYLEKELPVLAIELGIHFLSDNKSYNHELFLSIIRIYKTHNIDIKVFEKIVSKIIEYDVPIYLVVNTIFELINKKRTLCLLYDYEINLLTRYQTLRSEQLIRNLTSDHTFNFPKLFKIVENDSVTRLVNTSDFSPSKSNALKDKLGLVKTELITSKNIELITNKKAYYYYSDGEYVVANKEGVCSNSYSSNHVNKLFYEKLELCQQPIVLDRIFIPRNSTPVRNYCHWILDYLPLIILFSKISDKEFIVPLSEPIANFQMESIKHIKHARLLRVTERELVLCNEVFSLSTNNNYIHPINNGDRHLTTLLQRYIHKKPLGKPINLYISRDKSHRRLLNEEDVLLRKLSKYEFIILYPEDCDWLSQIELFQRAENIVSLHGAALSNIAFSPKCKNVIEIFPSGYGTNAFQILAESLSINYHYYFDSLIKEEGNQFSNVNVNIDDLFQAIEKVITKS
jgi:capsular polysaccharide biosynthesis protein